MVKDYYRSLPNRTIYFFNYHQCRIKHTKNTIPKRIQSHFGNECDVDLDCLNELIDKLLLEYDARRIADNKDRLILVVFEYRAEWLYMARFFPSALRYFSAWLDVIDFSREVAPGGNVPSLKKTLNPLGYSL